MSENVVAKKFQAVQPMVEKIIKSKREYPVFNGVVMAYFAVMLLFQLLFQISPVMTFLTKTPLYEMQTYLGLLGGVLIVIDLFTSKKIWRGKYSLLLYAILALAALASVRMISYGIKENLFKLCWAAIQFVLVYSLVYRVSSDTLKRYLKILFTVLLAIWSVCCCISIYQYAYQIGYMYVVNPLAKDASSNRQGFYDNRLFGIFYTLNHAAFISVIFFLFALVWAIKTKKVAGRIALLASDAILLCYIILSGSRSAALAMLACMMCLAWFVVRNALRNKTRAVKVLIPVVGAVLFAVCCIGAYVGIKFGLTYIPYLTAKYEAQKEEQVIQSTDNIADDVVVYDNDVLERQHLEEDYSNGRMSIWKDYVTLYHEVGPIGMSPGNYMGYILENHPEMYIVEYIRQNYQDKYESGIIYHVHSGYMMVYVSAGWIGLACLLAFITLCLINVFRKVYNNFGLSLWFVGMFLVVAAVAISAAFDEGIFFQNNPQTTIFWLCLGILMKECTLSHGKDKAESVLTAGNQ